MCEGILVLAAMLSEHARFGVIKAPLFDGNGDSACCIDDRRSFGFGLDEFLAAEDEDSSRKDDCTTAVSNLIMDGFG